jgi:hypothetical protein
MAIKPRKHFFINILSMLLGQRESVLIIAHKRAYVTGSAWDTKNNALPGAGRQLRKEETGKNNGPQIDTEKTWPESDAGFNGVRRRCPQPAEEVCGGRFGDSLAVGGW